MLSHNISEENIKRLDDTKYTNYISDDSYNSINDSRVSYADISPRVEMLEQTDIIPTNKQSTKLMKTRYFNQFDFFYFICTTQSRNKIKKVLTVLFLFLHNILRYGIMLNYQNDLTNIITILGMGMSTILLYSLFDKIKLTSPNITFMLVLFQKKQLSKLIYLIIMQIISAILSTLTLYYMYDANVDNTSYHSIISFSNLNYYKTTIYVIIYNIINTFLFLKSLINNEFIYFILADMILNILFIKNIYNVTNPIYDLTSRIILTLLNDVNLINNIIVPIITCSSIAGTIIGGMLYIILIDNHVTLL